MAIGRMSTLAFFVFACALAGLCHGEDKDCFTDMAVVMTKVVSCIGKKDPQDMLTILTRMKNPAQLDNPDSMCKNEKLMSLAVECMVQYMEGCMPRNVASMVKELMPTDQNIKKGIHFLCAHRQDFNDPCVESRVTQVTECFKSKLQTYSGITGSPKSAPSMRNALCFALKEEDKCLDSSLKGCSPQVISNLKKALQAFFPADKCTRELPQVLRFQSEGRH